MIPEELEYTREHEWVRRLAGSGTVRVGITDFAQKALGDIVFANLPDVGASVTAGEPCGEVESTKSVSDIFSPVSGVVAARNDDVDDDPALINSDPYGAGWLIEIDAVAIAGDLLDSMEYEQLVSTL